MNPTPPLNPWMRILLTLLGLGSYALGAVAVFVTENGTGAAILIAFGGICLLLALLGARIDSLEFGGATLNLSAAAAEVLSLAEDAEKSGDPETAARLRAGASALLEAATPIAAEYRSVRGSSPAGPARTRAMEQVVARARELANSETFEQPEVVRWLRGDDEGQRITALGLMQARPELRDLEAITDAIENSRSAFEQYHALRVALKMVDDLRQTDKSRLLRAVEIQRQTRRFRNDSDRWQLSEEILRRAGL